MTDVKIESRNAVDGLRTLSRVTELTQVVLGFKGVAIGRLELSGVTTGGHKRYTQEAFA